MKILQINSDYDYGSTGKITANLHRFLESQGIGSYVCYGRKNNVVENNTFPVISPLLSKLEHLLSNVLGDPYGLCLLSTTRVKKTIMQIQPDIIHIQCINGYFVNIYKLLKWLAKKKFKVVVTLHAEFMYTGGCDHAYDCAKWKVKCVKCPQKDSKSPLRRLKSSSIFNKFLNSFSRFDSNNILFVSVSKWLMERAKSSAILNNFTHSFILNGVNTNVFNFSPNTKTYCIKGIDVSDYILFVTAMFRVDCVDNKGGSWVMELAKRMNKAGMTNKIVVVSSYNSIKSNLPDNIIFMGKIANQNELASIYRNASVTVITSKRETYGLTVAESMCCGTPVVGFKCGGPESFANDKYSEFVSYGDIDALFDSVCKFLKKRFDNKMISAESISLLSSDVCCQKYLNIYKELANN